MSSIERHELHIREILLEYRNIMSIDIFRFGTYHPARQCSAFSLLHSPVSDIETASENPKGERKRRTLDNQHLSIPTRLSSLEGEVPNLLYTLLQYLERKTKFVRFF